MDIGINKDNRIKVVEELNKLLADEVVLGVKTRNFHWNVKGPHFNDLHKFFEEQYNQINDSIDEIAERVRMLDEKPLSTLNEFLSHTRLKESASTLNSNQMIQELLDDQELLIKQIRSSSEFIGELKDSGTEDFLVGLMQEHEKMAWMLRSTLN